MNKRKLFFMLTFLLIGVMVLSACTPTTTNTNNEPAANEPVANEPAANEPAANEPAADEPAADEPPADDGPMAPDFKNEDTYVYVTFGEPETLDPAWTYETSGSALENNIYESLIWFQRERNDLFVPMLATSWGPNDAGDEWTFTIREGVTFHAGGTLEPHDVAYSMQRALLQDRVGGPHWMTHEAFFGTFAMADNVGDGSGAIGDASAGDLLAACEAVKEVVVADDAAGTVTFKLATPTPWFLALIANNFVGNVLDMEWMIEQGAWDGDCATWQNWTDPAAEDTVLFNNANGTGPYVLDHWTPGEEIVLVRNENYWRQDGDPVWEGGPSGVARIGNIVELFVDEWGTRLAMLEAGDADYISAPPQFNSQLEPNYGIVCDSDGTCEDQGGWIQAYLNNARPVMTPAQFNWQINSEGGNVMQGSGQLDGNGIPDDFFNDIHIRKAFSYCFDYDTVIQEALDGEGQQAQGPIIAGMLGYRDDGYVYSYDLDKCAEEFQASETGVWDTGFYMQMAYNTGNDTRRLAAEVLKNGIEEVNPDFQIQVVAMPWPVLLASRRASKLPIYVGGWAEDFHDPHNWVHPFLHSQGAYGAVVAITEPTSSIFDDLIAQGAAATTADERRPIYEEIQLMAQEEAVMIWMYQPLVRYHFSPWIEGWYFNAAYSGPSLSYVYALDKVGP